MASKKHLAQARRNPPPTPHKHVFCIFSLKGMCVHVAESISQSL